MLIDAHAHVLPGTFPSVEGRPACWPRWDEAEVPDARLLVTDRMRFTARDAFYSAEARLAAQQESRVDAEVLSPMPPLLDERLPAGDARDLSRCVNDFIAELCGAYPERFHGLGMVPIEDPELAAAELTRVRGIGLRGVEITSQIRGRSPGDPHFLPFFAEAERLELSVFVHAMPGPMGTRLPASAAGTYVVGIEGAIAAASFIIEGTAAACPDLRVAFSHAAGGLALMLPRARYFWGRSWNEDPPTKETEGPSPLSEARRFYYDGLVFDRRALRYVIDMLGADRVMVGSDFPAIPREHPAGATLMELGLDDATLENITAHNPLRWLGLAS
ncbi:MAG: amidohydrolase family protein [Streptosporangiales bacterium]|nr:amidohydrolase family protein [Streptosporangiales bacterium]